MSQKRSFGNYYKRRVARIYPSVLMVALVASMFWGDNHNLFSIIINGGGWFVPCIMMYYVPFYFVSRYGAERWLPVYALALCVVGAYFALMEFPAGYGMYGDTWFKWVFFFLFMLQGAYAKKGLGSEISAVCSLVRLLLAVVAFYLVQFLAGRYGIPLRCQVLSLLPLALVCHEFHRLCHARCLVSFCLSKWGKGMQVVSGLCLEIYMIQSYLFTDKLNFLFPLNLLVVFLEIVAAAYLLRCLSRLFVQTFCPQEYDWKTVFRL